MAADSCVPTEKILVAKFDTKVTKYARRPDAVGWTVKKHKVDRYKPFRFRFLPEERDTIRRIYPKIPIKERQSAFLEGQPLLNLATPIHTCGTDNYRPKILYRLTHDRQPYGGRKPRGHGHVNVDPFSFHIFFHKHLDWRCRNPSPFLSATDSMEKINHIYGIYKERGFQNIRLIIFRSYGPGWDHRKQKLYHVCSLLRELGGRSRRYVDKMAREFILEGEIPRGSIIEEGPFETDDFRRPAKNYTETSTRSINRDDGEERVLATAFTSYI